MHLAVLSILKVKPGGMSEKSLLPFLSHCAQPLA